MTSYKKFTAKINDGPEMTFIVFAGTKEFSLFEVIDVDALPDKSTLLVFKDHVGNTFTVKQETINE